MDTLIVVSYWGTSPTWGPGQIVVPPAWRSRIRNGQGRCNGWTTTYGVTA